MTHKTVALTELLAAVNGVQEFCREAELPNLAEIEELYRALVNVIMTIMPPANHRPS